MQSNITFAHTQPIKHSKYSSTSINLYNSGLIFQKQGKYNLAELKYKQALQLQPNFVSAKKNLKILYQNMALKDCSASAYDKAISDIQKALALNPNDPSSLTILAQCYKGIKDTEKAIKIYNKILLTSPNNDIALHSLGLIYTNNKDYEQATKIYNKILLIKPNDKVAKQNLTYLNFHHSNDILNEEINNIKIERNAPDSLYKLVKISEGVPYDSIESMNRIIDLLWSEPNGKIMLQTLLENKTPINITPNVIKANATRQIKITYIYGTTNTVKTNSSVAVNIPFKHIEDFNNQKLYAKDRIYNLQAFAHEFGHAFIGIKNPNDVNSIEEEIGVSMIGYNIANKVITGEYLNREQTKIYSLDCLQGTLSDEHRSLPIYSNFNKTIQYYGIAMPYPDIYSNIPSMYRKLLSEDKIKPVVSFEMYKF